MFTLFLLDTDGDCCYLAAMSSCCGHRILVLHIRVGIQVSSQAEKGAMGDILTSHEGGGMNYCLLTTCTSLPKSAYSDIRLLFVAKLD